MKNWLVASLAIMAAGCGGSSPTAPATPALTTNASLTVARHETSQLHAQFGTLGNASDDVTAAATWTSSDSQVVTVNTGLVTAVGIGHATITVEYQGQTKVVPVTARRRMAIDGTIRLTNAAGKKTLRGATAWLDSRDSYVGYVDRSDVGALSADVIFKYIPIADRAIDPGSHQISVIVGEGLPAQPYISGSASHIDILDFDTGEHLATIPLAVQQKTLDSPPLDFGSVIDLPSNEKMTWTIQVDTYSS